MKARDLLRLRGSRSRRARRLQTSQNVASPVSPRQICGRAVAYTMMKKLLPLALIAVACEAMAQDAQCVPERAAMVETVRLYARSEAGVLGPQGISETVLQAMGQAERHRFTPGRSCSLAYMDGPDARPHEPSDCMNFTYRPPCTFEIDRAIRGVTQG